MKSTRTVSKPLKIILIILISSAAAILTVVAALSFLYPNKYRNEINAASREFGVDAELIQSVIHTESRFKPQARSHAGAEGLMQLMPSTAQWIARQIGSPSDAENLYDVRANIRLGTALLKYLLGKYSLRDALAAYNAGEGNLLKWKAENRAEYAFKETRDYVKKVLRTKKVYDVFR